MNHSSHILLLAVALSAAGIAPAQTAATPEKERARATGPTYGPVLHPQAAPASQATPAADARPQAQEERAAPAQQARQRQDEPDPSARPAPQPPQPEPGQKAQQAPKKDPKAKPAPRRPGAQQRIEPTARITAPSAQPDGRVPAPVTTVPAPATGGAQISTCQGNVCTDASGTSYATGVGNAAVNSSGRLCNRSGTVMQCF